MSSRRISTQLSQIAHQNGENQSQQKELMNQIEIISSFVVVNTTPFVLQKILTTLDQNAWILNNNVLLTHVIIALNLT